MFPNSVFDYHQMTEPRPSRAKGWTFLTNHLHVLVVLKRDPKCRISDIGDEVGITYRAVQRILAELVEEQVVSISKDGRRNVYSLNDDYRLRHPLESQHTIGKLLNILA